MQRFARPITFCGGLLCGIALAVPAIGIVVRASAHPRTRPEPSTIALAVANPPNESDSPPAPNRVEPPALIGQARLEDSPVGLPPAIEPASTAPVPAPLPNDPEKDASAFVEKTRREAQAAVQSLAQEAEGLRDRLKRIDAALLRWEALLTALVPTGKTDAVKKAPTEPSAPAVESSLAAPPEPILSPIADLPRSAPVPIDKPEPAHGPELPGPAGTVRKD